MSIFRRRSVILVALFLFVILAALWWGFRPRAPHVTTASVVRQTLVNRIFATGVVRASNRQVILASAFPVANPQFLVSVGDKVKVGQLILTSHNQAQKAALVAAQSALSTATKAKAQAYSEYISAPPGFKAQLYGALANAQAQLATAQAQVAQAQAAYDATSVRSQVSGQVLLENPEGMTSDGTPAPLMEVVSTKKQVIASVSEVDAVHIRPGMTAQVTTDVFPNKTWKATIGYVAQYALTSAQGTGQVEVDMTPNSSQFPVPIGYQVDVHVVSSTHKSALVVPYDALVQSGQNYVVFTYKAGRAHRVSVNLGLPGNTVVEVTSGLKAGDVVITNPPSNLQDGQAVMKA